MNIHPGLSFAGGHMDVRRWLLLGLAWLLAWAPVEVGAQTKEDAEDFVEDVLKALLGPNLNLFLHGGLTTSGRMLLQSVDASGDQRVLKGDTGFNVGAGIGVDVLLRLGFRLGYTYSKSSLIFRTDNGGGSERLDLDDLADLKSHVVSFEILRYMLPSRIDLTPYASLGVVGAWWVLGDESSFVDAVGGSTHFRMGAIGSFGLQAKLSDHLAARLEGAWGTVGNPFTGKDSFRVTSGTTIDEPTRLSKDDFRVALVYHFSRPDLP